MKHFLFTTSTFLIFGLLTFGQKPEKLNASEIYQKIEKLNFLGSVLYIAAHPDDENTRLISYLSNQIKAQTAYLSLTRGDGGQNLIGSELRELLGVIRTQELIEARKIDGGQQFFSRANDFGFSKTPDETLKIWDKDLVLADVVWIIRNFQPDVIINRFDHRTSGTTHGHHTASALLSVEAFNKSNQKSEYTNQLNLTSIWQPKRLFFNTSWWFYGSREKFEAADKSNLAELKIGVFYPFSGKSNQEIAALSRSCHQSQGFGTSGTRGEETEFLEFLKGDKATNKNDIFEGIDTTWNRINNGNQIGAILIEVQKNFDFKNPSASISELVKAYDLISKLDDSEHWKNIKLEEIKKIIAACTGLYLEASTQNQQVTQNSLLKIKLEAINRSATKMFWSATSSNPETMFTAEIKTLDNNKIVNQTIDLQLNNTFDYTQPYYLKEQGSVGMYVVNEQKNVGKPDVLRDVKVTFFITIDNITIPFERNVVFKTNDDVKGEVHQPLDIVPIVTASFKDKVTIFPNNQSKSIAVFIKSGKDDVSGAIHLDIPDNWAVSPKQIPFSISIKGQEQMVIFTLSPPADASEISIKSVIVVNEKELISDKVEINYPHIYKQIVLKKAESRALKLNIKIKNEKIAYIMGVGDEVPKCLKQMGYEVDILKPEELSEENLKKFDVVITGIRAYNVVNQLEYKQKTLLNFVQSGKTMIVQYNTLDDLVSKEMAPFKLKISHDRVTEEDAEVRFLNPNHAVLNYPNKLSTVDFTGWKQEQGLYYPSEWGSEFETIISSNDANENPKNSAILVAKYGKGHYIYTGLSFFRELPEGVSGAYRLFANLISIKNN